MSTPSESPLEERKNLLLALQAEIQAELRDIQRQKLEEGDGKHVYLVWLDRNKYGERATMLRGSFETEEEARSVLPSDTPHNTYRIERYPMGCYSRDEDILYDSD